jgi:predicted esterase
MREEHLTVGRTARYFTLGESGEHLREVWFVCHGYGQLAADFLLLLEDLDDGRRLIVAPEGLSRYYTDHTAGTVGASWMTRDHRPAEIADYIGYLDALYEHVFQKADRASVSCVLLGFSQGAATASRWAALGRGTVDRLVLWAGMVPPDLDLERNGRPLRDLDLVLVVGTRDEVVTDQQLTREANRLTENSIGYRLLRFDGGHRLDAATLRTLAGIS